MIKPRISVARRSFFRAILLRSFSASYNDASTKSKAAKFSNNSNTSLRILDIFHSVILLDLLWLTFMSLFTCAGVSLGAVGDLTGSEVITGLALVGMVDATGVALTMFAIAEGWFAQPLLEDFRTPLRSFGPPPLKLDITDVPLECLVFKRPVSIKSLASEKIIRFIPFCQLL